MHWQVTLFWNMFHNIWASGQRSGVMAVLIVLIWQVIVRKRKKEEQTD